MTRLPRFSPVALKLLSVLADERAPFKEIARLIALDPVLAGEVLRLANSGLYGRWLRVSSLLEAIARLGTGRLSQFAMTAALWRGLPRKTAPFVREWWRHSIAAALLAQHCGQEIPADHAYTAALLHGIGQLALFEDAPNDYPNLVERAYAERLDLLECEREVFHVDHPALAALILGSWGLPDKLCEAVAAHHDLDRRTSLIAAVQTGCHAAEYVGFGRCGCPEHSSAETTGLIAALLANHSLLDSLVVQMNQIECSLG
ncbi:MAG: HDOD domain-containing protein [Acidobacteriota bacterium]|nr:HDOD domain-containing protein [Acidobacteriota bacterium]